MGFTAPTFMDSNQSGTGNPVLDFIQSHIPAGWPGSTASSDSTSTPATPPAPDPNAVVQKLNLPAGWTPVSAVDGSWTDDKGKKQGDGTTIITLAGPNGQPGTVVVDQSGNVKEPLKVGTAPASPSVDKTPSPIDQWVKVPDTQGNPIALMDPKTGATVDLPHPAAPRADTPAETQNAATSVKNADTAAKNADTTAANDAAARATGQQDADTRSRIADLQAAKDKADQALTKAQQDYNDRKLQADTDYQNGKLSQDQWIAERNAAHQEAQDAVAAQTEADRRLADEKANQIAQGQLANQTTQTQNQTAANAETSRSNQAREAQSGQQLAETSRANQANEANNAAVLLEHQQNDKATQANQQGQLGATLLNDRATHATGLLSNWVNAAASNKNFGLGGGIPSNLGASLMSDAGGFATQMMGGQSTMDQAAQLVHQANPALSGTPQGAAYTAVASQMLDKQAQAQNNFQAPAAPAPGTPADNSNTAQALAPPGVAGALSPSDPRFLGTLIAQTAMHLSNQFSAPDLSNTGPRATGGML